MRLYFRFSVIALLLIASVVSDARAKVIEYNFDIDYKTVNFTGKDVRAMSVGGSIPAPKIEATVGDTLRVTFNNKMDVESSIHWHGILLPNDQDGVPYLTTPPIRAGTSFTFEFPIKHHGTYWYHSHTGLQEQRGVYGPLVFHPKEGERVKVDRDVVVVLSDWTDENPDRVMHNLKKSHDYYALKKGNVLSWLKVLLNGTEAIGNRIRNAWIRMGPMHISDVGYDAFLANGEREHRIPDIEAGDKVRLRVINAAASSYFHFQYAGGEMMIVSADGVDVQPINVNRQRIAIAETFDVIVTVPDGKAYEFRATAEDGTGYGSVILGDGSTVVKAPDIPKPNMFLMSHSMHGSMKHEKHGSMGKAMTAADVSMAHGATMDYSAAENEKESMGPRRMTEYELLRAVTPTNHGKDNPEREVTLELTGGMDRYDWSFNNKVLSEESKILIRRGEIVRFVMKNRTMMHHPIHLHGHFFRVLNGQGRYSPLKHTVNVPPMQSVTIEFMANEEKDWFFHCHNLYHMKAGMSRVVSYEDTTQATRTSLAPLFSDRDWFFFADIGAQTNFTNGDLRAENTRSAFNIEYEWDYDEEYEVEVFYERYMTGFSELYAGWEFKREENDGDLDRENMGFVGVHYVLPFLIEADLRLDTEKHVFLSLGGEPQLTDRLSFEWNVDTDYEYRLQLEYEIGKHVSLTGNRDDQFDWGFGLEIRY